MQDQLVPVAAALSADVFGPLEGGERVMWRGHAGVAEYAFDRAASLPRWTLPETTEVLVTDRRVIYAYAPESGDQVITSGELRWLWPQYLRLQPGARSTGRGPSASQIQLVCGASDGSFPALVFAGGELRTVADADRMANVLRQTIARFRVDHATPLGLSAGQARMLSRLLIGPEFMNHQGGDGQTVSLLGAMLLQRPGSAPEPSPRPAPESPAAATSTPESPAAADEGFAAASAENPVEASAGTISVTEQPAAERRDRPGLEADVSRAWAAARAEKATQSEQPALAERAADLAARIASLVAFQGEPANTPVGPATADTSAGPALDPDAGWATDTAERFEVPTTNLAERAEAIRRSAARFAANSAGNRAAGRRPDVTTQGRS